VTSVTDTSADNDENSLQLFESAINNGTLKQQLVLMGNGALPETGHPLISRGALKILLDEASLPSQESLLQHIHSARQQNRTVAFHCVTETEMVFALSTLKQAGSRPGDRIEHASICPNALLPLLQETGVSVVSQPDLLRTRGIQYQQEVAPELHALLYRARFFIDKQIPFALSSDAPYGEANPWQAIHTACQRRNPDNYCFGEQEKLSAEQALRTYFKDPLNLSRERKVSPGEAASLCLLKKNWVDTRKDIARTEVRATVINGQPAFRAD
jgi:predicted amidohydrolase YtcJ